MGSKQLFSISVILILGMHIFSCQQSGNIPDRVGNWRVEVGPAGNEIHEPPTEQTDVEPPSEAILSVVRMIAPEFTEINRWEVQRNDRYFIRAEGNYQEYDFLFSKDGQLLELEFENDATNAEEEPGELILEGTKQSIAYQQVHPKARTVIGQLHPQATTYTCWVAKTPVGERAIVQVDDMAYFVRSDGQIQAVGLVTEGALDEVKPVPAKEQTDDELRAAAEAALSKYRDRFGFQEQIEKLKDTQVDRDGGFRFVVMGDSRSNPDLWQSIIKHIDMLDPKPVFVLNSGDIVVHGYIDEYLDYYIPPLLGTDIPYFVALGNHDDGDSGMAYEYQALFGPNSLNYYFDYGGTRFIMMDNCTVVQPMDSTIAWLENVLESTPDRFQKIVCTHQPAADIEKWAYHAWDESYSHQFTGLMEKYKVSEVFFGHIHAYSTATLNGIPYTVAGGGGAGLHKRFGPLGNVHHYVICDVNPDGSIQQRVLRFYPVEQTDE
jgi:hypothetical protein